MLQLSITMLMCRVTDTFQALIQYSDAIAAQTAKVVSELFMHNTHCRCVTALTALQL